MFSNDLTISRFDPELATAMAQEDARQEAHIELIASENYCSPAVMEAQGSKLTNKYAEGYPGKRYYGGCARKNCLALTMPTCNHMLARKPTAPYSWLC